MFLVSLHFTAHFIYYTTTHSYYYCYCDVNNYTNINVQYNHITAPGNENNLLCT